MKNKHLPHVMLPASTARLYKQNEPVAVPKYVLMGECDFYVTENMRFSEMCVPLDSPVDPGAGVFNISPFILAQLIRDIANVTFQGYGIRMKITSGYRTYGKHMDIYRTRDKKAPMRSHHMNFTDQQWSAFDFKLLRFPSNLQQQHVGIIIEEALFNMKTHGGVYYIGNECWHVDMRKKRWRGAMAT